MEIILAIISILGFALSIYNFVLELYKRHKRLIVEIKHVFRLGSSTEVIHLQIINQSSTSVCITRIETISNGTNVFWGDYRTLITEKTRKTGDIVKSYDSWCSDKFPQKIESGGVFSGLLLPSDSGIFLNPGEAVKVTAYTDRGTVKKEIIFNDFSPLELLSQCREPD